MPPPSFEGLLSGKMSFALSVTPQHPFTGRHFLHAKMYPPGNISSKWLVLTVLLESRFWPVHLFLIWGHIRISSGKADEWRTEALNNLHWMFCPLEIWALTCLLFKIKNVYLFILKKIMDLEFNYVGKLQWSILQWFLPFKKA